MPRRSPSDSRTASNGRDNLGIRRAIELAAVHHPHPNPRVGAVVVDADGQIVGEGAHKRPGTAHAERLALAAAGTAAAGGTLYVTLEPCNHHGRTPPCVDAVLESGVARVVIGVPDPDPAAAGGAAQLRASGVTVDVWSETDEAVALDPGYFHHRRTGHPLVTLKLAATLDGQAAAADGTSQWLTGPEARADVHRLRAASDAVMVGAGTLRTDDPHLGARLDPPVDRHPQPVVIAGSTPLPAAAVLYDRAPLIYAPEPVADEHRRQVAGTPATVVGVPGGVAADLPAVINDLGARGVVDLLVEGGPTLAVSLVEAGLVDRIVWYGAALLGGGVGRPVLPGVFQTLTDARRLEITSATVIGGDVRLVAEVVRTPADEQTSVSAPTTTETV